MGAIVFLGKKAYAESRCLENCILIVVIFSVATANP